MRADHWDLLAEFVLEGRAALDRAELDLGALVLDPGSPELPATVLRELHTIKGTSSLLGLAQVESAAHAGEELLCRVRDGSLQVTDEVVARLRRAVEEVRTLLLDVGTADGASGERSAGDLWEGMSDLVAHLAGRLGRQVELTTTGDVVLGRSLVEAVRGLVIHLVRNALDHGLEPPEARVAAGKPPAGRLRLHVRREVDEVVIEVGDDGRGIDLRHVAETAVARRLVTREELAAMAPGEVMDLVFRPGLSTASVVTEVSGRGVGMDVVRTGVERVGGSVELVSVPGEGTTCRLRVPVR
jgi:two-component system chemotaxis sensor kinase CheA